MLSFALEQVNTFCLNKQHLIPTYSDADVYQVTHDIIGLQAVSALTPYLSLLARIRNFSPESLLKELYLQKRLVKVRCMRGSLFILPIDIVEAALVATAEQRQSNDLVKAYCVLAKTVEKTKGQSNPFEASKTELEDYERQIIQLLKNESLTIEQLKKRLDTHINISYVVYALCDAHKLIRGPTTRWDNNKHHYTAWENRLPEVAFEMPGEQARAILIKQYIKSYGPVCLEDIIWWTGFGKEETVRTIKEMGSGLVEVSIDCFEGKFFLAKEDQPRLKATKCYDEPMVSFLPAVDNYMVAYRKRGRHSLRDIYHKIHDKAGNVLPVILIDGQVAGIWDHSANKVEYTLFDRVDVSTAHEVKQRANTVSDFLTRYL